MTIRRLPAILLLCLAALFLSAAANPSEPALSQGRRGAAAPPTPEDRARIIALVGESVAAHEEVMAFLIYDVVVEEVLFSADGNWALATLAYLSPDPAEPIATEPGIALARRLGADWAVTIQADKDWDAVLAQAPEDLVSYETKKQFTTPSAADQKAMAKAIGGYHLPWPAGGTKLLTQSVNHSSSMAYAFDFYESAQPMWPIVAARTGTVKYAVWSYPNGFYDGNANHANYLVLEDTSTVPTTYQVYLHLAQDSIPVAFRTPGARIYRGQFLGIVDDTGYSTGHHLHFQVHSNASSWWGNSIDITFDDVSINGGRPRRVDEAAWYGGDGQNYYVSGNKSGNDFVAPTAGITAPADQAAVSVSTVRLSGYAADSGSGFSHAYFIANTGSGWEQVGPIFNSSPFSYDWNMCDSGLGAGAASISLRAWDRDGNPVEGYPGLRSIVHTASCPVPPPACSPSADQVALFAEKNFGGACTVMDTGDYASGALLAPVGGDEAASIRVGANVIATLYSENDYYGRVEAFESDDRSLEDNPVGADSVSSLRVLYRNATPGPAEMIWPATGASFERGDALVFFWRTGVSALYSGFEADTVGPLGEGRLPYRSLDGGVTGTLGAHTWYLIQRSCSGSASCLSEWRDRTFQVTAAPAWPAALTAPFADGVEGTVANWTATGLWRVANSPVSTGAKAWVYNRASDSTYNTGTNYGFLTSPPVYIPAAGYTLRFKYWVDSETSGPHWDQRRVQIAVDGGNYVNLYQLSDDKQRAWQSGPFIDLSAYAGHNVRVRFAFFSGDEYGNANGGWAIDDFQIAAQAAPACADPGESNNTAATASVLGGATLGAQICPAGDMDYYRFTASAGSRVVARVEGTTALQPYMVLLDTDGSSVLAASDGGSVGFQIPVSGTYYVKVRSANHPAQGGTDHGYTIRLTTDSDIPTVSWVTPSQSGQFLSALPANLVVNAGDGGGVAKVEIFSHSSDWAGSNWTPVCTDTVPSDGWSCPLNPASLPEGTSLAFQARVTDWAGNQAVAIVWGISNDRTAPTLAVTPLPAQQDSTVVNLAWTAGDSFSGLAGFDIQLRVDSGAWTDWVTNLAPDVRSTVYAAQPGHAYAFRVIAEDRAGNTAQAEVGTTIKSCTPDGFESDNTPLLAKEIFMGVPQRHTSCPSGDSDWVFFQAAAGTTYLIRALAQGPTSWTVLELVSSNGTTVLLRAYPPDTSMIGQGAAICWIAPRSGVYFVRAYSQDPMAAGDETAYDLVVSTGYCGFLPGILR
ncbi:MAG: peptidoglycan DD-metalloendopeptidase family protein [Anaerolineales bacterium]|nr:peptidoglycan DD-metalloendopeptidase family protein [Anaerolineales bacterium]